MVAVVLAGLATGLAFAHSLELPRSWSTTPSPLAVHADRRRSTATDL
jgi:hypothetical protein